MARNINGKRMYTKDELQLEIFNKFNSRTENENILFHIISHDLESNINLYVTFYVTYEKYENSERVIKVWQDGIEEMTSTDIFNTYNDLSVIFEMADQGVDTDVYYSIKKGANVS